ncbi:MAG: nucleotidyltransferase domain-containing protein [Thermaerobacter sp.]|nr:nucleotidyltransferase domain-containing protein [Thermaerobacter sp.]
MDKDAAQRSTVQALRGEFGERLIGVLLVGSRAYGTPHPLSDWDFFVLIDATWRQRRVLSVGGNEVELLINPVSQVRKEFKLWEHPATIDMFAHGLIVEDSTGQVAELQAEASRIWRAGPPPADPKWTALWRYALCDVVKDVQDLQDDDPRSAEWLTGQGVLSALVGHYRLNRRWLPQQKYLLKDLSCWDESSAALARDALDPSRSIAERVDALWALSHRTLSPVGGWLEHWDSDREELPDANVQ